MHIHAGFQAGMMEQSCHAVFFFSTVKVKIKPFNYISKSQKLSQLLQIKNEISTGPSR